MPDGAGFKKVNAHPHCVIECGWLCVGWESALRVTQTAKCRGLVPKLLPSLRARVSLGVNVRGFGNGGLGVSKRTGLGSRRCVFRNMLPCSML